MVGAPETSASAIKYVFVFVYVDLWGQHRGGPESKPKRQALNTSRVLAIHPSTSILCAAIFTGDHFKDKWFISEEI